MKLHLVLDHDGYLLQYAVLSDGKEANINAAKKMSFAARTMLIFDRGYADYDWWLWLEQQKVFWIGRTYGETAPVLDPNERVLLGTGHPQG